jgi:hypothetical protein
MTRRRQFLQGAAGLLNVSVAGRLLTPRLARAKAAPFAVLTPDQTHTLDAVGEILVPGAREAGLSHYIDHQLAASPAESLLMLRYFDIPPPYAPFYAAALASIDAFAHARSGATFASLPPARATALVAEFSRAVPKEWHGPPSPLVYIVLRSDAVDVVYGTEEGFASLGVPYQAHIPPPTKW